MKQFPALILALTLMPGAVFATTLNLVFTEAGTGEVLEDVVVEMATAQSPAPARAEMGQQNRAFNPRVLVVSAGSRVDFPNRDNTQHHVYSFSPTKPFELELYAGRPEAPVVFERSGVVEIGCNIHDHMRAFILVTDSNRHTRSDAAGKARLELPPGHDSDVTLSLWHPRLEDNGARQRVTLPRPGDGNHAITLDVVPAPATDSSLERLQKRFQDL